MTDHEAELQRELDELENADVDDATHEELETMLGELVSQARQNPEIDLDDDDDVVMQDRSD